MFVVGNRILTAVANHVRKGLVAVVGRTLLNIPECDGLGRIVSANYPSIHEAGTYVSSALTIMHSEIVGTCTDVLTMENACFSCTQNSNLLQNERTYRGWAHGTRHGD